MPDIPRGWRPVLMALTILVAGCGAPPDPAPAEDAAVRQRVSEARRLDLDGQQDAAIARYRQALERQPDSFDAHYGLGRALDLAGEYDEARRHFSRAIELAPEGQKEQTLRMMGIAWTFVGDAGEASRYFREVFDRRVAESNHASAAEEANELGRMYLELGNLELAEQWYGTGHEVAGRAADRRPWQVDLADMRLAHARARVAARRGDVAAARRQAAEVERLLDKGGNDEQRIHYPHLLGYVAFQAGEYQEAIAALAQADQDDPFVLELLAQAHDRLGHADEAREYYEKVLQSSSHGITSAFARPRARQYLDTAR
jgi:tetratricopeptide (TPR) repeat protein